MSAFPGIDVYFYGLALIIENIIGLLPRAYPRLRPELNVCVTLRKSVAVLTFVRFGPAFFVCLRRRVEDTHLTLEATAFQVEVSNSLKKCSYRVTKKSFRSCRIYNSFGGIIGC